MAKSKHRYEIILYWSEEDGAYIAEFRNSLVARPTGPRTEKPWKRPRS